MMTIMLNARKKKIPQFSAVNDNNMDSWLQWELLKYLIKQETIKYSKSKLEVEQKELEKKYSIWSTK